MPLHEEITEKASTAVAAVEEQWEEDVDAACLPE
jgi:hypothetical protein